MEDLLTQLKLARIREVYRDWIDKASKEEMSYSDFLHGLLSEEICAREENQIKRRMRKSEGKAYTFGYISFREND